MGIKVREKSEGDGRSVGARTDVQGVTAGKLQQGGEEGARSPGTCHGEGRRKWDTPDVTRHVRSPRREHGDKNKAD